MDEGTGIIATLRNDVEVLTESVKKLGSASKFIGGATIGIGGAALMAQGPYGERGISGSAQDWGMFRAGAYGMHRAGARLAQSDYYDVSKLGKGMESLGKSVNISQLKAFNDSLETLGKTGTRVGSLLTAAFKPLGVVFNPYVQATAIAIDITDKFTKKAAEARNEVEKMARSLAYGSIASGEKGVTQTTYELIASKYAGQLGTGRKEALGYIGQVRPAGFGIQESDLVMKVAVAVSREQGKNMLDTLKTLVPQIQRVTGTMTERQTSLFLGEAAVSRGVYSPRSAFSSRPSFSGALEEAGYGAKAFRGATSAGLTGLYYALTRATPGQQPGFQRLLAEAKMGLRGIGEDVTDAVKGVATTPITGAGKILGRIGTTALQLLRGGMINPMKGKGALSYFLNQSQAASLFQTTTEALQDVGQGNIQAETEDFQQKESRASAKRDALLAEQERRTILPRLNALSEGEAKALESGDTQKANELRRQRVSLQGHMAKLDKAAGALGITRNFLADSEVKSQLATADKEVNEFGEKRAASELKRNQALGSRRRYMEEMGYLFKPGEAQAYLNEQYRGPEALSERWGKIRNIEGQLGRKVTEREQFAELAEKERIAKREDEPRFKQLIAEIEKLSGEIEGLTGDFKSLTKETERLETRIAAVSAGELNVRSGKLLERGARFEAERVLRERVLGKEDRKKMEELLGQENLSPGAAQEIMKRAGIATAEFSQTIAERTYPIQKEGAKKLLAAEYMDTARLGTMPLLERKRIASAIQSGNTEAQGTAQEILKLRKQSFEQELQFAVQYTQARMNVIKEHYDAIITLERTKLDEFTNKMRPAVELGAAFMAGHQARMSTLGPQFAEQERRIREPREARSIAEQKAFLGFEMAGVEVPPQVGWALRARAIKEQEEDIARRKQQEYTVAAGQVGGLHRLYGGLQAQGISQRDLEESPEGAQMMLGAWQQAQPGMEYAGRGAAARSEIFRLVGKTEQYSIRKFRATQKMRQFEQGSMEGQLGEMEEGFRRHGTFDTSEGRLAGAALAEKYKEAREMYAQQGNVQGVEEMNKKIGEFTSKIPEELKTIFNSKDSITNTLIETSNKFLSAILDALKGETKGGSATPQENQAGTQESLGGTSTEEESASGMPGRLAGVGSFGVGFNVGPSTRFRKTFLDISPKDKNKAASWFDIPGMKEAYEEGWDIGGSGVSSEKAMAGISNKFSGDSFGSGVEKFGSWVDKLNNMSWEGKLTVNGQSVSLRKGGSY